MSWKQIRASDFETMRLRRIVSTVVDHLKQSGSISSSRTHICQIDFYRFLQKLKEKGDFDPEEVLNIVMEHPDLAEKIKSKKFEDFLSSVQQLSTSDRSQEILFVTTFYANLHKSKSFFRAVLKTKRSIFGNFSRLFVYNIFRGYPFLRDATHLKHVMEKLDEVDFAYHLTKDGIKEVYDE